MSKYKPTFKIGDWVKVNRIAKIEYDSFGGPAQKKSLITYKREHIGQICGAIYRYEGKRKSGWGYDEPPSFIASKACLLWQVKINIVGKPVEALEEDIDLLDFQDYIYPTLPFRAAGYEWTEKDKDYQRNQMKYWPRDKNGRFKAYTEATPEERELIKKGNGQWLK